MWLNKYRSFCSSSWKIFPERSGTYTSGAGLSSSPQLSSVHENRAASDERLLPTSSFHRALGSLACNTYSPCFHPPSKSYLFRLVLLMSCNLLSVRISFQGIQRSAFIANPSSTGIWIWRGFDCRSSCLLSSSLAGWPFGSQHVVLWHQPLQNSKVDRLFVIWLLLAIIVY